MIYTSDELLEKVYAWHTRETGMKIYEYLGWTREQYAHWVETGEQPLPPPHPYEYAKRLFNGYGHTGDWYPAAMDMYEEACKNLAEVNRLRAILRSAGIEY